MAWSVRLTVDGNDARQWLLEKGKHEGGRPEVKPHADAPLSVEANRWEFRFPRS